MYPGDAAGRNRDIFEKKYCNRLFQETKFYFYRIYCSALTCLFKQKAKNELKDILDELDRLNKELLQTREIADINKLKETKNSITANIMVTSRKKPRK